MIVIYLQGGLGNQLFQYAFGRSLQIMRGDELYLDLSHFQKADALGETPRQLQLNDFATQFQIANADILSKVEGELHLPMLKRIRNKILPYNNVLTLNDHSVWPLEAVPENEILYLRGYFQKEKYFVAIRKQLLSELQIKYTPKRNNPLPENAVSVHVRRGDYVTLAAAAAHHGTCTVDYYLKAMEMMRTKAPDAHFAFFSDDIEWCKATFSHLENVHFMEKMEGMNESEDMFWMSRCRHHIIANSSYSWWGAWLNPSEEKIVMAPARWNTGQQMPFNDYVPGNWIQIHE